MIKTVVFDLGGVLFSEGKSIAVKKLAKQYQYSEEIIMQILTSTQSIELRKGVSTDEAFWNWAQKQLPEGYDAQTIKKTWYDSYVLDREIFDLVKRLSRRYRIAAFSGNIKSRIEYFERKYDFQKFFDEKVYSYEVHLDKPEMAFVQCLLQRLDQRPEEIVYIDDEMSAATPAAALGINVLIYSRGAIEELHTRLSTLGVET